jgi:putative transposase
MLAEHTRKADVEVWAYCLMPNGGRWRGHLFYNRFASVAMDEGHLISAVRYVALNPVRARFRQGLGAHSRSTHCAARARPQTFQAPRRPATPALTQLTLVLAPYSGFTRCQ